MQSYGYIKHFSFYIGTIYNIIAIKSLSVPNEM